MTPTPDPALVERVARAICKRATQSQRLWQGFIPEATAAIAALRDAGWREATEPLPEDVEALKTKIDQIALDNPVGRIHDAIARQWLADRQRAVEAAEDRLIGLLRAALKDAGSKDAWAELDRTADAWRARTRSAEVTNNGDHNV